MAVLHVERIGPDLWCLSGVSGEPGTPLPTVVGTYSVVSQIATMLMTGFADQRERTHELDALVHDVIAKPFSVDQIKGAVREALVQRH